MGPRAVHWICKGAESSSEGVCLTRRREQSRALQPPPASSTLHCTALHANRQLPNNGSLARHNDRICSASAGVKVWPTAKHEQQWWREALSGIFLAYPSTLIGKTEHSAVYCVSEVGCTGWCWDTNSFHLELSVANLINKNYQWTASKNTKICVLSKVHYYCITGTGFVCSPLSITQLWPSGLILLYRQQNKSIEFMDHSVLVRRHQESRKLCRGSTRMANDKLKKNLIRM